MKTLLFVMLIVATAGCQKKPDSPAPDVATATGNPPAQPTPPPVTNCQGGTVMYSMPIDTQADSTAKDFTIPNFEISCGDTLRVYIRSTAIPPGSPFTEIFDSSAVMTYYTIHNQTVTVHNETGNQIYVDIEAILK